MVIIIIVIVIVIIIINQFVTPVVQKVNSWNAIIVKSTRVATDFRRVQPTHFTRHCDHYLLPRSSEVNRYTPPFTQHDS